MEINTVKADDFKYGNWRGLIELSKKEIMRFWSVGLQTIVAPVITTILFYLIFSLAFGGAERTISGMPFLKFLAPGLIIMAMVQNAFANSSSSWIIAKIQGNITDVLLPPFSATELYIGNAIGSIARGLCVGVGCYVAMIWFAPLSISAFATVFLFAFLGTWMLGNLGLIAGIWADKFDHIAVVTNFVVTPLAFLSGTFYTMNSLPEFWQFIAKFNPFYYMIDGFRQGFIGQGDTSILIGAGVLVAVNLLLSGIILIMLRSGFKIKA